MKNQWTTISEKMDNAHNSVRNILERQEDSPKSRKIPIVLASGGVFLMLVGSAPFLFEGKESSFYSADITTGDTVDFSAEPALVEEEFDLDVADLPEEDAAVPGIVEEKTLSKENETKEKKETTEISTEEPITEENIELEGVPLTKGEEVESIHAAAPPEKREEEIVSEKMTAEVVDFPKNVHTGKVEEAIDLESFLKEENGLHAAASEEDPKGELHAVASNAGTGTPLLPLFALSGILAFVWAKRKKA